MSDEAFPQPTGNVLPKVNVLSSHRDGEANTGAPVPPLGIENSEGHSTQQPISGICRSQRRKKALLIGVSYSGGNSLSCCIGDVILMARMLHDKFNFRYADFRVLADRPHSITKESIHPTREAILQGMHWLVEGARPGDSLFFYFSGHGSQVIDTNGDESDGLDETILSMDYMSAGHIVDDEIHNILVDKLPAGVRLTVVMDCCHSGSNMDLPYTYDADDYGIALGALGSPSPRLGLVDIMKIYCRPRRLQRLLHSPNPHNGEVLLFSACRDNQTAVGWKHVSALTFCFISVIAAVSVGDSNQLTYRSLLRKMRERMRYANLQQVPQFSTSHPFDLSRSFTI